MRSTVMRALLSTGFLLAFGPAFATPAGAAGPVTAARHHGTITGDTIRWTSIYRLRSGGEDQVPLAFALPPSATIDASPEVAPVARDGRVVGLSLRVPYVDDRALSVSITEPLDRRGREVRLAPPLAAGDAVQIVDVEGGGDLRFEPDARTHLARHVGFFAPVDLPPSARDAADRAVGYRRARATDDPVYLTATSAIAAEGGLRGTLVSAAERLRTGALGAGAVFVALIAALALLLRKLAHAARIEQAERALAAEFAHLDTEAQDRA